MTREATCDVCGEPVRQTLTTFADGTVAWRTLHHTAPCGNVCIMGARDITGPIHGSALRPCGCRV